MDDSLSTVLARVNESVRQHSAAVTCIATGVEELGKLAEALGRHQDDLLMTELAEVQEELEDALNDSEESEGASDASTEQRKESISGGTLVELETARERIAALEESEAALQSAVAALERRLAHANSLNKQLTNEKSALLQELATFEEKVQSKDDLIAYLEGQVCSLQGDVSEISRQHSLQHFEPPEDQVGRASYPGSKVKKTMKGGRKQAAEHRLGRILSDPIGSNLSGSGNPQ